MRNEAGNVTGGNVVQAGVLRGDVHLHESYRQPRPRQVPIPAQVSGRVAELSRLDSLGGRVRVISGIEGVGKSTLGLTWSRQVREAFPGGQFYVDLSAYRDRPWATAVGDVLAGFLRALGVTKDFLSAEPAELQSAFRTLTEDQPVLVVIDSAWSANEVLPLVPGGDGGVALVTSNDRLGELMLHGARPPLELAPLDVAGSLALFTELVGEARVAAEPEAARAVAQRCAGLPLALNVLAARLNLRSGLAIADLVAELGDGLGAFVLGGKQVLMTLFGNAYANLPEPAARLYRLLGAAELEEVGAELATALLGADATESLRLLADAHLVEETDERYRFHGLVAAHAREIATDGERDAGTTALRWYLERAACADLAITGGPRLLLGGQECAGRPFADDTAAIAWLDAERRNLLPLLRKSGQDELVWRVAESLTPFYYNCRYLQEWIEVSELGIAAARRCGHADATARLLTTLSRPLLDQDELERAKQVLDEALELATRADVRSSVHEFRGRYFDRIGQYADAVAAYRSAMELTDDPRAIALATCFLGAVLAASGDPAAEATLREAVALLENEPRMRARALVALGSVVPRAEAAEVLREAVGVLEGRWPAPEAEARVALAKVLEGPEATEQLRRAHAIYARFASPKAAELADLLPEPGVDE